MMTTLKRLLALLTAAALCLCLCACKDTTGEESGAPEPSADVSAEPDASAEPSAEIVADLSQTMYGFSSGLKDGDTAVTVNGTAVSNQYFFYWLSNYCYNTEYNAFLYGQYVDFTDPEFQSYLLESTRDVVVYHAVLRELCAELGVTVTAEQREELQGQIDEMGLDSILLNLGVDEATFQSIAETNYLFTNYAEKLMGEPTAADLEKYVEDHGIFGVKHILLKTTTEDVKDGDGNVTETADEHNAAQKATAEDLLAQLRAADDLEAKFDELMNQYSEDGRNQDGTLAAPDGYTFDENDSLVDGFREATLALEVGELSGIVETAYGYHILLRLPVDASQYKEDWFTGGADEAIMAAMDKADVAVADDITGLDVNDFYERYMAYSMALYDQQNPPAESAEPSDGPEPVTE